MSEQTTRRGFIGLLAAIPTGIIAAMAIRPFKPTRKLRPASDNVSMENYAARLARNGITELEEHKAKYDKMRRPSLSERLGERKVSIGKGTIRISY